ncbi:MAG: von Willebrand factor type A domain-containing protein, partial [Planctomycetes bacterium]|nr:von Willebrand factor type A domain-containing protein [Planctomycetota bacterium]
MSKSAEPTGAPAESPRVNDALGGLGYLGDDQGEEADAGRFRRALRYDEDADDLELEDRKRDFAGRRIYTDDELDAIAAARCERVLLSCRRLPNERPNMMFFRFYGDNAFELAHLDPLSTFGADVDTASYTLARRYLRDGLLPEKAQIRTEEFVNYFKPDLAPPPADSKVPFAVHTELGVSRFGRDRWATESSETTDRWMLRVGVRGKEVAREERQPLQLTFVVDTSGS